MSPALPRGGWDLEATTAASTVQTDGVQMDTVQMGATQRPAVADLTAEGETAVSV